MKRKTDQNPAKPGQIVLKLPFVFEPDHDLLNLVSKARSAALLEARSVAAARPAAIGLTPCGTAALETEPRCQGPVAQSPPPPVQRQSGSRRVEPRRGRQNPVAGGQSPRFRDRDWVVFAEVVRARKRGDWPRRIQRSGEVKVFFGGVLGLSG